MFFVLNTSNSEIDTYNSKKEAITHIQREMKEDDLQMEDFTLVEGVEIPLECVLEVREVQ